MRQINATEARKHFFQILDSAINGETIIINRKGVPLELVPTRRKKKTSKKELPNYKQWIHSSLEKADQWSWQWDAKKGLTPTP